TSVHSARAADVMAERFLAEVGTTDPRALRALPAGEVERAGTAIYHAVPVDLPGRIAFAPVVDGELVVEPPAQVLQTGRAHPVPLLLGTNRDEASAFRFMKSPLMPITPSAVRRMFDEMAPGTDDVPN